MVKMIAGVLFFAATIFSSVQAAETGVERKALGLIDLAQALGASDSPVVAMPPVPLAASAETFSGRLSPQENQNILLSVSMSGGKWHFSGDSFATNFIPHNFKLVGGTTLLVEVTTSFLKKMWIPVRLVGDKYEYGPWSYAHCGSDPDPRCWYTAKVQLEVVSGAVLQGTIFLQPKTSAPEQLPFVMYME